MNKKILNFIDAKIYSFLKKNCSVMPIRFVKEIAFFYTDARIRKLYLARLGVRMGENTYPNLGFRIVSNDFEEKIIIGKNVSIAVNAVFICDSSANNGEKINTIPYVRDKLTCSKKIIVKDEAWIGANVTIMPGVTIGEGAVIGAGSIVTRDVPDYCVVVGSPAKIIRNLKNE